MWLDLEEDIRELFEAAQRTVDMAAFELAFLERRAAAAERQRSAARDAYRFKRLNPAWRLRRRSIDREYRVRHATAIAARAAQPARVAKRTARKRAYRARKIVQDPAFREHERERKRLSKQRERARKRTPKTGT